MNTIKVYKHGYLIADIPYKTKDILKLVSLIEDYLESLPEEEGDEEAPPETDQVDMRTVVLE